MASMSSGSNEAILGRSFKMYVPSPRILQVAGTRSEMYAAQPSTPEASRKRARELFHYNLFFHGFLETAQESTTSL